MAWGRLLETAFSVFNAARAHPIARRDAWPTNQPRRRGQPGDVVGRSGWRSRRHRGGTDMDSPAGEGSIFWHVYPL